MSFSEETIKAAWKRAGGKCECRRKRHNHPWIRCGKVLVLGNQGRKGRGAWEAHHVHTQASGGYDSLSNCEILCWECHRKTI